MPFPLRGSGDGAGFSLGPPTNMFTGASTSAAETARDTYFTANADNLAAYDSDPGFLIQITVGTTETYQRRSGGVWVDVTHLVTGPTGAAGAAGAAGADGSDGSQGPQGVYQVQIYIEASATPMTPTGGSVDVSTGAVTAPTDWMDTPFTPTTDQLYVSEAHINPSSQTGSVTPTWSAPYEAGGVGPAGARGETGRGITEIAIDADDASMAVITYTDSTTDEIELPAGPQGIQGPTGSPGSVGSTGAQGVQGRFEISIYRSRRNSPGTPTGGTYVISTGVLTAPQNWSASPVPLSAANHTLWEAKAVINPLTESGNTVTPTWSGAFESGELPLEVSSGGTQVTTDAVSFDFTNGISATANSDGEVTVTTPAWHVSTSAPQSSDGVNGDFWIQANGSTAQKFYRKQTGAWTELIDVGSGGSAPDLSAYAQLAGAIFTGAVVVPTPTEHNQAATKDYVDANDTYVNAGSYADGVLTLTRHGGTPVTISGFPEGGGGMTPTVDHTSYLSFKATNTFASADFTKAGVSSGQGNVLVQPSGWTAAGYLGFARPASVGDFTQIYIYVQGSRNTQNQITAWTQQSGTVDIGGEAHNVLVSNAQLTPLSGTTLEYEVV